MLTVPAYPPSGSKNSLINNNKFRKTSSTVQFRGTPNNSASEQSHLSDSTEHLMPTTTGQEDDLGDLHLSKARHSGSRVVGCGLTDFFQSAFMTTVKILSWPAKAVNRVTTEFRKEQAAAEFREKQRTINMAKKTMTMNEIYKTLHEKGITGKGIQVSVLDGGKDLPEESFRNELLKMILPSNQHQAYVSNLIKDAAPDAQVHVLPATSHLANTQAGQELKKLFRDAFQQPDSLTLQKLREAKMPVIQDLASKIRKEIDNGTKVINLSLSIDKSIYGALLSEINRTTKRYQEKSNLPKEDLEKGKTYLKKLNQLMNQWKRGYQSRDCNDLYKPWWDALDYAHDKGVLIVKSSGNFGKIASGNYISPMTSKKHPALLVVGSTNEEGVISNFSSVYAHEDIQPDIAANGCGELYASHAQETDLWYLKPLQYLLQRDKTIGQGTSFSAPDLTSLYVMSQSARQKAGKEPLTIERFRQVLKKAAQPGQLQEKVRLAIEESVDKDQDTYLKDKRQNGSISDQDWPRFVSYVEHIERPYILKDRITRAIRRQIGNNGTIAGKRLEAVALAEDWSDIESD